MRNRGRLNLRLIAAAVILPIVIGGALLYQWKSRADLRFVRALGSGWNLGNTLDVHRLHFETDDPAAYEIYWNNPITARALFVDVKAAGFDTVRIPVTWYEHMNEQDQVDEAWMNRVQQLTDYALEAGLSVIINAHHDPWYTPDDAHLERAVEKMRALWSQVARRFEGYGTALLFESMNEPRLIGTDKEWSGGTPRARQIINRLNTVFVQTVREAGGNNAKRYLLLPTYCARPDTAALEDFRLPKGERLILSVHLYFPYAFAQKQSGTSRFDPKDTADTKQIGQLFKDIERLFIRRKIPVIITEFGAIDKDNEPARVIWAQYILDKSRRLGIPCVWWDAGGDYKKGKSYSLYDRYNRVWLFPELVSALTQQD